ncbi:hypothetical protein [Paenarthrobacter nitroguajacolicus]|uniref:hypothetical protein n=1 Tax=Paenarthrobacter nitroguajacolicus TaxID=211146 RepID=UPI001FCB36C0|nr:hypothetical protein [Paenarthrobacter nitroguajacolicus]
MAAATAAFNVRLDGDAHLSAAVERGHVVEQPAADPVQPRLRIPAHVSGQITPTGERSGPRSGVISFTAVRQSDGRWLAVSAQNTDIVPGMQTHVVTDQGLMPESYEAPRER